MTDNKYEQQNSEALRNFVNWLQSKGLPEHSIQDHRQNVLKYVVDFLARKKHLKASEGISVADQYLGNDFIKSDRASVHNLRDTFDGLLLFYEFLSERGEVEKQEVDELRVTIDQNDEEWLKAASDYWDDLNP